MKKKGILINPLFVAGIMTFIVILLTAQSLLLKPKTFVSGGLEYTHYNNYLIFKQSFFHLIENKDLYQSYPAEHWDYYKYSPTFSLLIAPLANLPDALGLFSWNLLNVLVLFFALWKLPPSLGKKRLFMLGFILIELITSIQNSQSNGLIAGLIVCAFLFLEKKQIVLASLFIVLTIFIKLFGVVALALFVFYPHKRKAIIYTICWILILAILPLFVVSFSQLSFLYQSWLILLNNDHSAAWGMSVAGWLHSWFGIESKNVIVIIGVVLFCLPFLKYKFFNNLKFKLFFLSSILIWIVIFNHKAESPTLIIAISGVAIWGFSQKIKVENVVLLIIAIIFTTLSPTDIFPKSLRNNYIVPYVLKAVPCILIWFKITLDLIFFIPENNLINNTSPGNSLPKEGRT
jgi:hypothetical protein